MHTGPLSGVLLFQLEHRAREAAGDVVAGLVEGLEEDVLVHAVSSSDKWTQPSRW